MTQEFKGVIDKTILVKLTSRERPDRLKNCINQALIRAQNPSAIKWLISLDVNDNTCNSGQFVLELQKLIPGCFIIFGASQGKIDAINRDLQTFTQLEHWDILVNLSDDQICERKDWDKLIRDSMPNDLDWSLWFNDSLQNNINTMEIIGRKYYERFGFIYNPSYKSFYCDEESTHVARILKRQIKNAHCLFRHEHPAGNKEVKNDRLYDKNQKWWDEDKAMFNQRWQINFGV